MTATPEPLWSDERIDRLVLYASGGYDAMRPVEVKALAAQMRDDYEAERAANLARIAELEAALAEATEWEEVPRGTYYTFHRDGFISYGPLGDGRQLSVSQIKKSMKIFVGTLPDGWQLMRRKAGAKEE